MVVLGHCIQYGSGNDFLYSAGYYTNTLFRTIYAFHMPLFSLISGYLFRGAVVKYSVLQNIRRQALRLLLPTVCWTIAYECYLQIVGGNPLRGAASPDWIRMLPETILNSHWFFWGIFWSSIIVLLVNRWGKDRVWIYALFCLSLPLFSDQFLVRDFYLYAFIFPYFAIGHLAARIDFRKIRRETWCAIAVVLLVIFVLLMPRFSKSALIYTTKLSIWKEDSLRQIVIDGYRWIVGAVGAVLTLLLVYPLWKFCHAHLPTMNRIVCFWGKQSAGIYIISTYLNFEILIRLCQAFSPSYLTHLLLSACVLAVCSGIVLVLERTRMTRLLALGRRR